MQCTDIIHKSSGSNSFEKFSFLNKASTSYYKHSAMMKSFTLTIIVLDVVNFSNQINDDVMTKTIYKRE